jgi:hypothetical protein
MDALRFVRQYRGDDVAGLGDFDGDNNVDDDDLQVFASDFGQIGWDAYQVSATATDEDGTYTSNTLPVVDPPPPADPVSEVAVASDQSDSFDAGQDRDHVEGISRHEGSGFDNDPALGRVLRGWLAKRFALQDESGPFGDRLWRPSSEGSLIDLYGDNEDEDMFGETETNQTRNTSAASWIKKFVCYRGDEDDSMGPNGNIQIVFSEKKKPVGSH